MEEPSVRLSYKVGDTVVIAGGVFAGYKGTVQEISEDQKELTVLVSAGRREMPIMLSTSEVKADKDNA